eukprot:TRINITY_DN7115_c0_g1_i2.p1 TRINITY_DN7115_c0_g1~~TRINITY_DN7115_c0_g1_i2.p1  ORF type:complete len:253 (+),score=57.83 TRINITY_DN7115_c0_g1_i2:35-793(+)
MSVEIAANPISPGKLLYNRDFLLQYSATVKVDKNIQEIIKLVSPNGKVAKSCPGSATKNQSPKRKALAPLSVNTKAINQTPSKAPKMSPFKPRTPGVVNKENATTVKPVETIPKPTIALSAKSPIISKVKQMSMTPNPKSPNRATQDKMARTHSPHLKTVRRTPSPLNDHRVGQRKKQLEYGYNTIGYLRYRLLVPKDKRAPEHPRTPKKDQACSKRSWDGQLKKWRRDLHKWDPEDPLAFKVMLESEIVVS